MALGLFLGLLSLRCCHVSYHCHTFLSALWFLTTTSSPSVCAYLYFVKHLQAEVDDMVYRLALTLTHCNWTLHTLSYNFFSGLDCKSAPPPHYFTLQYTWCSYNDFIRAIWSWTLKAVRREAYHFDQSICTRFPNTKSLVCHGYHRHGIQPFVPDVASSIGWTTGLDHHASGACSFLIFSEHVVSSFGKVFSLQYSNEIRIQEDDNGYHIVLICADQHDGDHSVNVYVHRLGYSSFNSMTIPEDQCYRSSSFQLVSQSENRLWVTDTTTTTQQQSNVLCNIFLLLSRNDVIQYFQRKQHVYRLVSSISYYQCTYISLSINDVNADNINWKMQLSTDDEGRSDYGLTRLTWMVILDLNAWLYYRWRIQEVLIQDLEHSLRQIWWHWR